MEQNSEETLKPILDILREYNKTPTDHLPEELFLFSTELTPMINVDLLIRDDKGRILLSWRKDRFYEEGWHVPGGIIRLKETFEQRIMKVAEIEIGCSDIHYDKEPMEIVQIICPEMEQRGHFITLVYNCSLPDGFVIKNAVHEFEAGYLQWHSKCPGNILKVHRFYEKYWD